MSKTRLAAVVCVSQLAMLLSACGGGSSASAGSTPVPPLGENPTTPTIEGVAMPSSVAVVTATNTQ